MGKLISVFSIVFLFSVVWHLPAAWVYQYFELEKQLPPKVAQQVQINEISGAWWQGQVALKVKQDDWIDVGQLAWQWLPTSLFSGELALTIHWSLSAHENVSMEVATNGEVLKLSDVIGSAKVASLATLNEMSAGLLDEAKGEVFFKSLNIALPLQGQFWPESISGELHLAQFEAMGIAVQKLKISPEVKSKSDGKGKVNGNGIRLNISGGEKGWKISGNTQITPPNRFQHNIVLKADSPKTMPDWVTLMMRKKSNVSAELKTRGRF